MYEYIMRQVNQKICGLRVAVKKYVDDKIAAIPPSGGGTDTGLDNSAPAMTKAQLAASSGQTGSVYLTDGTAPNLYAYRNPNNGDATPPAANSVIVDADGYRWYILSDRKFNETVVKSFNPFP